MVPPYGGKGELCAYGDTYMENVSWMKKNHMVDEILLLCHETLNKVAELRKYKTSLIEACYVNLQGIYIKYVPEPAKSIFIKQITPDLIYLFDGILSESDIYRSFAASFGANGYYQQALDYDKLALRCIKNNEKDVRNKKNTYI